MCVCVSLSLYTYNMYNEQQRGWSPITRPSINNNIKEYMGMSVAFTLVELTVLLAGWLSHVG